ncbi:hypothetical protein D3C86_2249910 [compost metagenome]
MRVLPPGPSTVSVASIILAPAGSDAHGTSAQRTFTVTRFSRTTRPAVLLNTTHGSLALMV